MYVQFFTEGDIMNLKRENEKINNMYKDRKNNKKIEEADKLIFVGLLLFISILVLVFSVGIQNIFK